MHPRDYSNIKRLKYIELQPESKTLEGLDVLLHLDSFCLGDTICFAGFLDAFADFYKPKKLTICTFWPELFMDTNKYTFKNAVSENNETFLTDKLLSVGYQKENLNHTLNGMFYAAKDSMGLPLFTKHKIPSMKKINCARIKNKISIAPETLKRIAKWNYIGEYGWQVVIDYLVNKGFEIHNVSYEKTLQLKNVIEHHENNDIFEAIKHICESRIFIGLSSGLSWLAWAYKKPVVMISGFTKIYNEFECFRVINEKSCYGCFNIFANIKNPCPIFLGTERENECHKSITPQMVIEQIEKALVVSDNQLFS